MFTVLAAFFYFPTAVCGASEEMRMAPRNRFMNGVLALVAVFALSTAALAQDQQPSKVDIFAGYSWLNPGGKLNGVGLKSLPKGYTVSTTYWLNKFGGIEFASGGHFDGNKAATIQAGPSVRFTGENIAPLGHALIGLHEFSIQGLQADWGVGITAGGGIDLNFWRPISIRMIEADYEYAHHHFGPSPVARVNNTGAKLSAGLVFHFGTIGPPPPPPTAACTVQPSEVFEGEPVTATATGSNFNPKRPVTYAWSGTGVTVSGTNQSTQVDTKGLQPGQYTVA